MAKSKSFWGLRRGSAGSLTFSKSSKGEQITRAKITSMKNPKSMLQNLQRMQFSGVVKLRAKLNDIVNHSFQTKTPKITSLSEFTRLNLQASVLRGLIADDTLDSAVGTKAPMAAKAGAGFPYVAIIANGSLPTRHVEATDVNIIDGDLSFAASTSAGSEPTFATLFTNNGIQVGDWLTFCVLFAYDSTAESMSLDDFKFTWVRFKVIAGGDLVKATIANMSQVFEVEQGGDIVEGLTYGMMTVGTKRGVGINFVSGSEPDFAYCGLVHSREEGGRQRSYTELDYLSVINDESVVGGKLAIGLEEALQSWSIGSAYVLDGGNEDYSPAYVGAYKPLLPGRIPTSRPVAPSATPEPEP